MIDIKLVSPQRAANAVVILFIAAITACVLPACKSNEKPATVNTINNSSYDSLKAVHDSLVSQYNAANLQVDDLNTRRSALDTQIMKKDAELTNLKKEVARLKKTNSGLASKLKNNEKFLSSIKDELTEKERSFAEKLGIMQADKDKLMKQLTDFIAKYKALKDLGSVLHASNIKLEPIHLKHNGTKEKKTKRARKMNVLRVHFDIDENRIAEDGMKQLYIVINGPDGKILGSEASATATFNLNTGTTSGYTVLKEIMLKQNEPVHDVMVDWKQEGEHQKGDYNISIYNGGYKIGAGSVTLK